MTERVVIVTGGATGIGAAITRAFLANGDRVLVAQQRQEQIKGFADVLGADARSLGSFVGDLADVDACNGVVDECIAHFGRVDVLVNNAALTGAGAVGPVLELADDVVEKIFDVNLLAAYRVSRAAARSMRDRGSGGAIINIGSTASFAAQIDATAYVAAKHGILGLTKGLALELAPLGIRVIMVAPGAIASETSSEEAYRAARQSSPWRRPIPLGSRGMPADIADAVLFMASPAAKFATGTALVLDGGVLAY